MDSAAMTRLPQWICSMAGVLTGGGDSFMQGHRFPGGSFSDARVAADAAWGLMQRALAWMMPKHLHWKEHTLQSCLIHHLHLNICRAMSQAMVLPTSRIWGGSGLLQVLARSGPVKAAECMQQ